MKYTIWLTSICNMDCDYCYEKKDNKKHMSMEVAKKIIEYISKDQLNGIHFHGGEVFTNIDVLEYFISQFEGKNVITHLTTNGTLIDNERAKSIVEKISQVSVSIDGNKESFLKNRHFLSENFCFEKLIEIIKELLRIKNDITARMTITPNNVEAFITNIDYLVSIGFKRITYAIDYYNNGWNKQKYNILFEKMRDLANIGVCYFRNGILVNGIANDKQHRQIPCMGGVKRQDIFIDGKIYPCSAVVNQKEFCIGDVQEKIYKNWKSTLYDINNNSMNEKCCNCNSLEVCKAVKCRFVNYSLTGNLYEPGCVLCELQKMKSYI